MNDENSEEQLISEKRKFQLEEGILIFLLILSLAGIGITHFSPSDGYWYWMAMILVFAVSALIIGFFQAKQKERNFKKLLLEQFFHWGSCMLVVGAMFTLLNSGHLSPDAAGLVILLLLSLATVLDGQRVGWRFSVVGLFLGISAIIASHFEHFMWIEVLLAGTLVAVTILWEIWLNHRTAKKSETPS